MALGGFYMEMRLGRCWRCGFGRTGLKFGKQPLETSHSLLRTNSPCLLPQSPPSFFLLWQKKEGFHFVETLTGFKWLGNGALREIENGQFPLFAYEEAIGYMCGPSVPDKDGVSACAVFTEMASDLYERGITLRQRLSDIYAEYGVFCSGSSSVKVRSKLDIERMFEKVRAGGEYHRQFEGCGDSVPTSLEVTGIRDLTAGIDTRYDDMKPLLPTSKSTQMVTFYLSVPTGGFPIEAEATLRTSGTEPKVKLYAEARSQPEARVPEETVKIAVDSVVKIMEREFWAKN
eukprot:Rmarinus@m.2605